MGDSSEEKKTTDKLFEEASTRGFLLKTISWYQIISGLMGILLLIQSIITGEYDLLNLGISIFGITLFAFVVFSGYQLLSDLKYGLLFSLIAQLIQVISFSIWGFSYYFCTGPIIIRFVFAEKYTGLVSSIDFGAFTLLLFHRDIPQAIGFNLISSILTICITYFILKNRNLYAYKL